MLIYKIFRTPEWEHLRQAGSTLGAPVDVGDGFVHFSGPGQLRETAAKWFAGAEGLWLLACDAGALGASLKWEPSRGGALFPHLYRPLLISDLLWARPLPLRDEGHVFPRRYSMKLIERLGLAALRRIDPEVAHRLALQALRLRLVGLPGPVRSDRLAVRLAGLDLPNPIGLAAGFDKNAVALAPLMRAGFGFLELGAATPLPQPGNPRPRLFRLREDAAVINRFGFNNDGAEAISARLALYPVHAVPVGLNLGANKHSADRSADFAEVLALCGPYVDFAVVNVSSPNTERLRDLQGPAALSALLRKVMAARANLARPVPVFLKIAPDLAEDELAQLVETALAARVDALVCTNTTLSRDGLKSPRKDQAGGLSGTPLFEKSTRVLAQVASLSAGQMPLIGVGGIGSGADAYAKIKAGASAVQLYTALAYRGLPLAARIARDLDALLERDGFASVKDAVGTERSAWL